MNHAVARLVRLGGSGTCAEPPHRPAGWGERWTALSLGLVALVVLLELGVRAGAAMYLLGSRDDADRAARSGDEIVILCLGESTTAIGGRDSWPAQLGEILGARYRVVNGGIPAADSADILAALPEQLRRVRPDGVVAMMGANDEPSTSALPAPLAGPWAPLGAFRTVTLLRQALHDLGRQASPKRLGPHRPASRKAVDGDGALVRERRPPAVLPVPGGQRVHAVRCRAVEALAAGAAPDTAAAEDCAVAGELVEALVANGPAGVPEETVAIFLSAAWEGLEQPGGAEVVRLVLDRALPRGPNTPGFMVDLGTLIGERGGWVVAEELAARALALDGSDVEALVLAARCAREGGDLATARRLLERAVDAAPGSFEACLGLVEVALAQGDRDVARHALGQAWARVPAEARALVSLGRASAALGMYGDARAAFTSAIGLDPRDPEPLVRRALAEQRLGRPEAAECDLREAFGRGEGCWAATLLMEQFARSDRVGEVERLLEEAGGPAGVAASLPCLIEPAAAFWEARGEPARAAAYRARAGAAEPPTAAHYAGLAATLATIGVPLVAVQYPGRDLAALRRLVPAEASVVLVDNGADIREAVLREGYEVIFWDHCYGDFGHGTRVGNRIIAENVAAAVRTLALEEGGSG